MRRGARGLDIAPVRPRRESLPPAPARSAPGALARLLRRGETRLGALPLRRLGETGAMAATQAAVRARAAAVPMQDRSGELLLCRVLGRYKLLVSAADLTHAPHLALDGYWKWWLTAFLARNLLPGHGAVLAGAGYGYFAVLAADLVGPEGRVLAIEANPALAALLRRNLALNGMAHATVTEGAVGATPAGEAPWLLAVPPESPLSGRLLPPGAPPPGTGERIIDVLALPELDRLVPDGTDWLLLDVNGAEAAAADAMLRLLGRAPGLGVILSLDLARHAAPKALLGRLGAALPLRRIDHDGIARPVAPEAVAPQGETLLYIGRAAPR